MLTGNKSSMFIFHKLFFRNAGPQLIPASKRALCFIGRIKTDRPQTNCSLIQTAITKIPYLPGIQRCKKLQVCDCQVLICIRHHVHGLEEAGSPESGRLDDLPLVDRCKHYERGTSEKVCQRCQLQPQTDPEGRS